MGEHELMKYFAYKHLPENLQFISKHFFELADTVCQLTPEGKEQDMALRKLLESKDCAVRSAL